MSGAISGTCDGAVNTETHAIVDAGYDIYGVKFDMEGNKLGSEFLINHEGVGGDQKSPSITRTPQGFVTVWQDSPKKERKIHQQRFRANLRYKAGLCAEPVGVEPSMTLSIIDGSSHDATIFDIDNVDECMEKACLPFALCQYVSYSPVKQLCVTYHKDQCDMSNLLKDEEFSYVSMRRKAHKVKAFPFTGADQTYVVPDGIHLLHVKLWGGGGGGGETKGGPLGQGRDFGESSGGGGGFTGGHIRVKPGDTFTVIVGGGGQYGCPAPATYGGGGKGYDQCAGAGGGRSAIIDATGNDIATAGGGGGGCGDQRDGYGAGGGGAIGRSAADTHFGEGGGLGGTQTAKGEGGTAEGDQHQGNFGLENSGGGGGGYYGGGSSTAQSKCGGGGSGFIGGLMAEYSIYTDSGADGLPFRGGHPPNTHDHEYIWGIGIGGSTGNQGGNGLVLITEVVEECEKTDPNTMKLNSFADFQALPTAHSDLIGDVSISGCYHIQEIDSTDSFGFHCVGPAMGYAIFNTSVKGAFQIEYTREDENSANCPVELQRNNVTVGTVPPGEGYSGGKKDVVKQVVRMEPNMELKVVEGTDGEDPKHCGAHIYEIAKLQCVSDTTCGFLFTTSTDNMMECNDGSQCDITTDPAGELCCSTRLMNAKCPPNFPDMCATQEGGDYPCKVKNGCPSPGGKRICEVPPPPAKVEGPKYLMRRVKSIDSTADISTYNVAPASTPFASGSYESGYGCTKIEAGTGDTGLQGKYCYTNINDGITDDQHAWVPQKSPPYFIGIGWADPKNITGFTFSRDMSGHFSDRLGGRFKVQYTMVPNPRHDTPDEDWTTVGSPVARDTPLKQAYVFGPKLECTGIRIWSDSTFHRYQDLPAFDEMNIYEANEFEVIVDMDRLVAAGVESASESESALSSRSSSKISDSEGEVSAFMGMVESGDKLISKDQIFFPLFITLAAVLVWFLYSLVCAKPVDTGDHYHIVLQEPLEEDFRRSW